MREALIIGGIAACVPYAWDSASNYAFSASQGQTQIPTFSGAQEVSNWEEYAAIGGVILLVVALIVLFL